MAHTVASQLLQGMNSGQIFAEDYNTQLLYVHAVKVFLMSYPEHFNENVDNEQVLFGSKVKQLMAVLDDLYGQNMSPTPGPVINFVWKQCQTLTYFVCFAVKRFVGRTLSENLTFSAMNVTAGHPIGPMALDHSTEIQSNKFIFKDYSFADMIIIRQQSHIFQITVEATNWHQNPGQESVHPLIINISEVHPEGYQQWVDFGRGTRLLVEVSFRVRPVENKDMADFHLQTIYRMIRRRLTLAELVDWHKHMTNMNSSICLRDFVQTNSHQKYWPVSENKSMDAFRQRSEFGGKRPILREVIAHRVPYFDLQKSVTFGDDIEETVCLCNEWCNWNAFFHFNPIYRFIMVQNSNLFIENNLNHPDMYLFAAVKNASDPTILPRTGYVIQLITSANYYRDIFYRIYMMASEGLMNSYLGAHPHPLYLTGVVYNSLKTDIDTVVLCQQLNRYPMADICIKNLIDYYKVYKSMHNFVALWAVFVDPVNQMAWSEEYENNCRVDVKTFVQTCIQRVFQALVAPPIAAEDEDDEPQAMHITARDRVFGSDVEYNTYLPPTADAIEIKLERNRALQRGFNPFNVEVVLHSFIHSLVCIYKFLPKLEVTLPAIHSERAAQHTNDYCIRLDRAFKNNHEDEPNIKFTVSDQELTNNQVPPDLRPNVAAFYTLKLYSFGWVVKRHCIKSKVDLLSYTGRTSLTQIADSFQFIYNNEIIEETLRNAHNLPLFEIDETFEDMFDEFLDFWGDVPHERYNWPDFMRNAESGAGQYRKLYVWYQNDGHNGQNFRAIIDHFGQNLNNIVDRSETILRDVIAPTLHWWIEARQSGYGIDVMDVLALYLVRASCYCTIKVVAALFRAMHSLQLERLCRKNWSFSMSKPGWKQLLMTINDVLEPLEALTTRFIVYDDEMERLSETLRQTTRLCRQFYKFLYMKLSSEWLREFGQIYQDTSMVNLSGQQEKACGDLMVLQLAVGLSFISSFVNHFRYEFWGLRRALWLTFNNCFGNSGHLYRFYGSLFRALDYLCDPQALDSDHPFATDIWNNYLNKTIPELQTLRPQDVDLDMTSAAQ